MKKAVFEADLFEVLKKDVIVCIRMKKLISRINITACPTNICEAVMDIKNLIDQICVEYNREVDEILKLQVKEQAQAAEFDKALNTSKASEDLTASRKTTQTEFDTYITSITLWESHIMELHQKIADAKVK